MDNKTIISRTLYLEKIKPYIGKNIIKVLTGQRRVGKSCILIQIINYVKENDKNANIIYINKENMAFRDLKNDEDLYVYIQSKIEKEKQNYLFIDEVQDIDGFENVLRNYQATFECDIFVTGSNAKMLSSDLATYISGRYIEIPIHSLSYAEYLDFNQVKDTDKSLIEYLTYGGLPYLMHLEKKEDIIFEYLKDVFYAILFKDIAQREKIRNTNFLEILATYTADNIGNLFSANSISKYLKSQHIQINTSQILSYLKAFCNARIVKKVQRVEINGLKVFEIGEKYYFEDIGLRNAICGLDMIKDIGKLMENVVFSHLIQRGFDVFVGKKDTKEIDFVCKKNNSIVYVQVAYLISDKETYNREIGNLLSIKDNYPKYIVTMNPLIENAESAGVKILNLRNFLLNTEF